MAADPEFPEQIYDRYRPPYPPEVFDFLAGLVKEKNRAWDCATGTGKGALLLAAYFNHVIATDRNPEMIRLAARHEHVRYMATRAEHTALCDHSVSLVYIGQAIHWFDLDRFYPEVWRIVVPGGIIAASCYHRPRIAPAVDTLVDRLFDHDLADYWHPAVHLVNDAYASLPFPFTEISVPRFEMKTVWNLHQLTGFIGTWSAVEAYRKRMGEDIVQKILTELEDAWGDPEEYQEVFWPFTLKTGRVEK